MTWKLEAREHPADTVVIFDGEGGELLTMSPNMITMHHSISGTHGGQDVYKGSVRSGCKCNFDRGGS